MLYCSPRSAICLSNAGAVPSPQICKIMFPKASESVVQKLAFLVMPWLPLQKVCDPSVYFIIPRCCFDFVLEAKLDVLTIQQHVVHMKFFLSFLSFKLSFWCWKFYNNFRSYIKLFYTLTKSLFFCLETLRHQKCLCEASLVDLA